MKLTKKQQEAVRNKFKQNPDGARSYLQFRRRLVPFTTYDKDGCVMLPWCGMWVGIETDGYTHT